MKKIVKYVYIFLMISLLLVVASFSACETGGCRDKGGECSSAGTCCSPYTCCSGTCTDTRGSAGGWCP